MQWPIYGQRFFVYQLLFSQKIPPRMYRKVKLHIINKSPFHNNKPLQGMNLPPENESSLNAFVEIFMKSCSRYVMRP